MKFFAIIATLILGSAVAFAPVRHHAHPSHITLRADANDDGAAASSSGLDVKSAKMLELLSTYKNRVGNVLVPRTHIEGSEFLGSWLDKQKKAVQDGTPVNGAVQSQLEAMGVFDTVTSQDLQPFDLMLGLLGTWKEREGNVLVPRTHIESGYRLGAWLDRQKKAAADGALEASQLAQLSAVGVFDGMTNTKTDTLEVMMNLMSKYKAQTSNVLVPRTYIMDGHRLGAWLDKQKQADRAGTLDSAVRDRLVDMGVFSSTATTDIVAGDLKKDEREGGTTVPNQVVAPPPPAPAPAAPAADVPQLSSAGTGFGDKTEVVAGELKTSERVYAAAKPAEPPKDVETGDLVVGYAPPSFEDTFDQMIDLLSVWKARENNVLVPRTHIEDGYFLGPWLDKQKKAAEAGTLDAAKRNQLEELGVFAAPSKVEYSTFDVMMDLLTTYKARVGNTFVPKTHVEDGHRLGIWLNELRKAEKYDTIDESEKEKLLEAGVIFHRDRVA